MPRPGCLVGTRWKDRDWRETDRVVEVVSVTQDRVLTKVVSAPSKPWTVDRESLMSFRNLTRRYRRLN